MVHISKIANRRLERVEDAGIEVGQTVRVKYMGLDERGPHGLLHQGRTVRKGYPLREFRYAGFPEKQKKQAGGTSHGCKPGFL